MDKILFIVPPYVNYESYTRPKFNERTVIKGKKTLGSVVADMPIGLLSISSYLKKHCAVEIELIDFNVILIHLETFEYDSFSSLFREVLSNARWQNFNPNIIGISTLFAPSYYNLLDIADEARKIFQDALIIGGGGIPTNMYQDIFRSSEAFDALCFGEGEKPMRDLIQSDNRNAFLKNSNTWITKEKNEFGGFEYDLIENLDEIPMLDYELLDLSDYSGNSIQSLFPLSGKNSSFSYMTSRGCPHHCAFCASHSVHGRRMRYHSVERIRDDFQRIKARYGVSALTFFDDHFMADKKRAIQLIDLLKESDFSVSFPNSLALYTLDKRVLELLKDVGMNHIVLSVESGSQRVLKEIMHKPLNLAIVERVISDCRELGISTDVAILMGLPGETKNDIEDAKKFFNSIKPNWFRFSMATPLVGSEMLDICLEKGYLKGDYLKCDFKKPIIETEDFTPEYIQETTYLLNLEFNFVRNSDYALGDYSKALSGFKNAIKVKNDHAFAYYFSAKCFQKMDQTDKYNEYRNRFHAIYRTSEFWREKVDFFDLEPLPA